MKHIIRILFFVTIIIACNNKKVTSKEDLVISSFQEFVLKSPDFKVNSVEIISVKHYDTISVSKMQDELSEMKSYYNFLKSQKDSLFDSLKTMLPQLSNTQKSRIKPFVAKYLDYLDEDLNLTEELMYMSKEMDIVNNAKLDRALVLAINYQLSPESAIETYYALSSYDGKNVTFSNDPDEFNGILPEVYKSYKILYMQSSKLLECADSQCQILENILDIIETSN